MSDDNQGQPPGLLRPYSAAVAFGQRALDGLLIVGTLGLVNFAYGLGWSARLTWAAGLAVVVFHGFAALLGVYRSWRGTPLHQEATAVLASWLATVPALLVVGFLTKTTDHFSRVVMTAWLLAAPASMQVVRGIARVVIRYFRIRGRNLRRCAVAGATELGELLVRGVRAAPDSGNRIVGVFDDRAPSRLRHSGGAEQVVGTLGQLVEEARAGRIDTVYIALPLRAERRIKTLISQLADTTANVCVVTDLFMFDLMRARWGSVGSLPVVNVFDTPFQGLGGWVKRAEDIALALAILIIVAIPMLFIALGVKLTSPGPVFFRQTRYGLNGAPIRVWKFRTMTKCEDGPHIRQASRHDARVTKFGAFLRQTSLDELPQFFNVLSGQMSVVGPRPHAVAHNELYRGQIRGYMLRHKVKPGITGWAQVNGWRGETEAIEKMEHRVEHDLYYIDNWSLLWDLQIIFLTVFGQRTRSNAY